MMAEFCDPENFRIILARNEEDCRVYSLKELLPLSFTGSSMKETQNPND